MQSPDLAGRWLAKFFTEHLAKERAASPRTVASYRDAMKLLLTWFKDAQHIAPERLRLADIDRPRVLQFLDWLEAERNCSPATRNQRLAVIKSFCRYTATEQPDRLDEVTQVLAIRQKKTAAPELGYLSGDEVKALLAQPGAAGARAVRDTAVLALGYVGPYDANHALGRALLDNDRTVRTLAQSGIRRGDGPRRRAPSSAALGGPPGVYLWMPMDADR